MDLDIRIVGGIELSKFYPEEFKAFEEKISDMALDAFPGLDGCWVGSELTRQLKAESEKREQMQDEQSKRALIEVLKEPEFQEILRARVAAMVGN
jgi:hypothetical protein